MFYGEKLRTLREFFAYSRSELADVLGMRADLLAQIEEDEAVPDFMGLQKLHKHLRVHSSYFFEAPYVLEAMASDRITYRNQVNTARHDVELERSFLNLFFTHLSQLENLVFPTQEFMMGFAEKVKEHYFLEDLTDTEIRMIAKTARSDLQIGTNQRLMYFLEVSGLYIVERDLVDRTDAYSAWLLDGVYPVIVLNNGRYSVAHRNYHLARELGHLLMHSWVDFDKISKADWKEIRRQAELFASNFLLPPEEFIKDFEKLTDPADPIEYVGMKIKYQVSILEMAKHAYTEGWLSDADYRKFWKQVERNNYNIHEPLDEELVVHLPGKLRALLAKAEEINPGLIGEWLTDYSVEVAYFERLFGIKDQLLREYLIERDEEESVEENIIRLDEL